MLHSWHKIKNDIVHIVFDFSDVLILLAAHTNCTALIEVYI